MSTATASLSDTAKTSGKGLHIALWVAQVLLALVFAMAGFFKVAQPISALVAQGMTFAAELPWLPRFIGSSELAGAAGLLLPSMTRIKPGLTPLAALGLLTVMILAVGYHLTHGEANHIPGPIVLGGLAAFIAWGRFSKAPITPRG